jgi:hypothetical protein
VPLLAPSGFVLTAAVLQVEYRILLLRIGVVVRRGVYHHIPLLARHRRLVPPRADSPWARLDVEKVHSLVGDFDPARRLAGAEEGVAAGVVHLDPVHEECVVVEAGTMAAR